VNEEDRSVRVTIEYGRSVHRLVMTRGQFEDPPQAAAIGEALQRVVADLVSIEESV
jgi:hypothetical protein